MHDPMNVILQLYYKEVHFLAYTVVIDRSL